MHVYNHSVWEAKTEIPGAHWSPSLALLANPTFQWEIWSQNIKVDVSWEHSGLSFPPYEHLHSFKYTCLRWQTDTQRGGLQLSIAVHLLLKDWLTQKVLVGKGMISCYLYVCLSNFGSSDLLVSFCGRAEKRQFFKFVHFVLVAREWCWLQRWWLPTSQDGSLWSITISCEMTVLHTQFRFFFMNHFSMSCHAT